ncbi:MAG TPA: hypothetical protein VE732_02005, partial [Nitrososphaera sp.]|nr:hypothetical protein [Nitrososphaera sp.]
MDNELDFEERVKAAYDEITSDTSQKYLFQPIPSELDGKIQRLIRLFRDSPASEYKHFFSHSDEDFSWLLITFAERMAA